MSSDQSDSMDTISREVANLNAAIEEVASSAEDGHYEVVISYPLEPQGRERENRN